VILPEETPLKTSKTQKRKTLKTKMASALNDDMRTLPASMKNILIDDLVTAFENRLNALSATQSNFCFVVSTEHVPLKATV
jgi:hypothetical protein